MATIPPASGLDLNVTSPTDGSWTRNATAAVMGTAGPATPDSWGLYTSQDLLNGTFSGTRVNGSGPELAVPEYEAFGYTTGFDSLTASSTQIDEHWNFDFTVSGWVVETTGVRVYTPPGLEFVRTGGGILSFAEILPGAIHNASLWLNYSCGSSGRLEVWASPDGDPAHGASTFVGGWTSGWVYRVNVNLTAALAGGTAAYINFAVTASAGSGCSLDDIAVYANYTRSAAPTRQAFLDDFTNGTGYSWTLGYNYLVSSATNYSDSPPSLVHRLHYTTDAVLSWGFATRIVAADVNFDVTCEANATAYAWLSPEYATQWPVALSLTGVYRRHIAYNATTALGGSTSAWFKFTAEATDDWNDSICGFDNLTINWTLEGSVLPLYAGTYDTPKHDLGLRVNFSTVDWVSLAPGNTTARVFFHTSMDGVSYTPFQAVSAPGAAPSVVAGRFVQLRVAFTSAGGFETPSLTNLTVRFNAIMAVEWSNGGTWQAATGASVWNASVPLAVGGNGLFFRAFDTTGAAAFVNLTLGRDVDSPGAPGTPVGSLFVNQTTAFWAWSLGSEVGSGVDHYLVDAGTNPSSWDLTRDRVTLTPNITLDGLADGQRLYLRVRAVDGVALVGPYSSVSVPTVVDLAGPAAPMMDNSSGPFTNTPSLIWSWLPAMDSGSPLVGFELWVGTTAGAFDLFAVQTPNTTATVAGLPAGTWLFAQVRAVDAAGNVGTWSAPLRQGIDAVPPTFRGFLATPGPFANRSSLEWTWAVYDDFSGVARFDVVVTDGSGTVEILRETVLEPHFMFTSAVNGGTVALRVVTVDLAGNVGAASTSTPVRVDQKAPTAPSFAVSDNISLSTDLRVSWAAASDGAPAASSGVCCYRWRLTNGSTLVASGTSNLTEVIISVAGEGRYQFSVSALDNATNQGPAALLNITVDLAPPDAVRGLSMRLVDAAAGLFEIRWNASHDAASGVLGYYLNVGTTPGSFDVLEAPLSPALVASWHGDPHRTYYVSVVAIDSAGRTSSVASAELAGQPATPTGASTPLVVAVVLIAGGAGAGAFLWVRKQRARRG